MSTKPKKKAPPSPALTLNELKSWLHGILAFQTKDWVPDKGQWETIKDKIFNLVEAKSAPQPQRQQMQPHPPQYQPQPVFQPGPNADPYSGDQLIPPSNEPIPVPPALGGNAPVFQGKKHVTPTIDSSDGYNTPFV